MSATASPATHLSVLGACGGFCVDRQATAAAADGPSPVGGGEEGEELGGSNSSSQGKAGEESRSSSISQVKTSTEEQVRRPGRKGKGVSCDGQMLR